MFGISQRIKNIASRAKGFRNAVSAKVSKVRTKISNKWQGLSRTQRRIIRTTGIVGGGLLMSAIIMRRLRGEDVQDPQFISPGAGDQRSGGDAIARKLRQSKSDYISQMREALNTIAGTAYMRDGIPDGMQLMGIKAAYAKLIGFTALLGEIESHEVADFIAKTQIVIEPVIRNGHIHEHLISDAASIVSFVEQTCTDDDMIDRLESGFIKFLDFASDPLLARA